MVKQISSGKNSTSELVTGVDSSDTAGTSKQAGNKVLLFRESFEENAIDANKWTFGTGGGGANPALNVGDITNFACVISNTNGGAAGTSTIFGDMAFTTPLTKVSGNEEMIITFTYGVKDWANGRTEVFVGLGEQGSNRLGTSNNIIGLAWKDATTAEWVTDKAGTEERNDSTAFTVTDNHIHIIKIVIKAGSIDFYCDDMDTPEATHSTAANLPITAMAFNMYTSTSSAEIFCGFNNLTIEKTTT